MIREFAISYAMVVSGFIAQAGADTLVPVHTIRAGDLVYPEDFKILEAAGQQLEFHPNEVFGLEAKRVLYAGRPLRRSDFGPPALIERNQIVTLVYQTRSLKIETEGRAMGRGGAGDVLRVINLASRTTVSGRVAANGAVWVNQ